MAIPWLIGAAVAVGVAAVLSDDDDSSSSSSSGSRELERERQKAEEERQRKIAQAEKEAQERRIAEQNRTDAQRLINNYALNISADQLVSASKNGDLEVTAEQAFQSSNKFAAREQQIEQVSKQLKDIQQLENELMNL